MREEQEIIGLLKNYTQHSHVKLVHRGNAAIMCALTIAKRLNPDKPRILIPDQGGWISYRTYPELIGLEIRKVRTDNGIIDPIDLENKAEHAAAFIFTSFAGYYAEQNLKNISEICKRNNCLIIEDASGAVGDRTLCNGLLSDIIVASFGKWKPVNNGYGGFISVAKMDWFESIADVISLTNFNCNLRGLMKKLQHVSEKIGFLVTQAKRVKRDLEELKQNEDLQFEILHKDRRGINVVVKPINDTEKQRLIKYCNDNGFDYVECPKYIRVMDDVLSIELKRLI